MASKSKKRRRVFRASCILAALIIAGSSFAWFTSSDEVTNRLSASADYGVSITESFTPPEEWVPGQSVNKDTYAVNTGTVDALVMQSVSGKMSINYETTTATAPSQEDDAVKKSKYVTLETKYAESVQPDGSITITSDEVTSLQAGSTVAFAPLQVAKDVAITYDDTTKNATSVAYSTYTGATDPSKCIYPVSKSAIGASPDHTDAAPVYYQNIIGAIVTAVDGTYTTKADNGSLSLTAGNPNTSNEIGVSFDGATFQPNTTGLYIFRRAIDKEDSKTADTTQDYEYVGYYYVQNGTNHANGDGTYYKVDNEALTAAMKSGAFSSYTNDEGLLLTYKVNENKTTVATAGANAVLPDGSKKKLVLNSDTQESTGNGNAVTTENYYTDDYFTYVYIDNDDTEKTSEVDTNTGHKKVTADLAAATAAYKYDTTEGKWTADTTKNGSIYVVEADKVVTPQLTWHDSADTVDHDTTDVTSGSGVNRPIILVAKYDNDTTIEKYEEDYIDAVAGGTTLSAFTGGTEGWNTAADTDEKKIANQKMIVAARETAYDASERAYVAAKEAYEAAKAANPNDTNLPTLQGSVTTALNKMNADKAAWAKSQGILDAMEKAAADDTIVNIKLTDNAITGDATKAEQWQMITVPMAKEYSGAANNNQVKGYDDVDYRFDRDTAYFYYTSVLESGQTSSQLIDSVELDKDVTQYAFKDIDFDLNIGLNSVQHLRAENGDEVVPGVDTKTKLQEGKTEFNQLATGSDVTDSKLYPKATYNDGTTADDQQDTEIKYIDWKTKART